MKYCCKHHEQMMEQEAAPDYRLAVEMARIKHGYKQRAAAKSDRVVIPRGAVTSPLKKPKSLLSGTEMVALAIVVALAAASAIVICS